MGYTRIRLSPKWLLPGGQVRTVYVGGQNSVDSSGNVVGEGTLAGRLRRPLRTWRLRFPLRELDWKTQSNGLSTLYKDNHCNLGSRRFSAYGATGPAPRFVTVRIVAGLANPEFLLEIEAVAVIPEDDG
jgi:hypothetical protein